MMDARKTLSRVFNRCVAAKKEDPKLNGKMEMKESEETLPIGLHQN